MFDLPFLIIGGFLLFKFKKGFWWILPGWLFLGIIPAAIARETPHALRIENVLPTFQIVVSYGLVYVLRHIDSYKSLLRKGLVIAIFSTLFLQMSYYLHGYYSHYSMEFSGEWQYGYKNSISYINNIQSNYDEVYFTTELGRPYAYLLFYLKILPEDFRKNQL